ncbi:MAG TPA: molybdopterin-dependent oxidoreductase [Vicinamibacterales bacterium]|nr:molybdopterin-dependent oxidoreductase [Vicinamibacterales bacterium]
MMTTRIERRDVLRAGGVWGGVAFLGGTGALVEQLIAQGCSEAPRGELLGVLPLHSARPRATPFGQLVGGTGLDARLFTDLSRIEHGRLITPTAEMFVRTTAPASLNPPPAAWTIATSSGRAVTIDALRKDAQPMGAHLIECSGNVDPDNFGLMSVTEWDGVPLTRLLPPIGSRTGASGLLVNGADDYSQDARTSQPGASWVFPLAQLDALGAFLAVGMNGAPLTLDHGAPVRLVVPGWFGCSWIKWVNELRLVGADEPATSQMIEFSTRTHQADRSPLARDYEPPVIDLAATPIRVEKRRIDGRLEYRIVGIVWGGDRPVDRLMIRFNVGEKPQPFPICPAPRTHRTWSLWDYRWKPESPGLYNIVLQADDPSIRTRRLDLSFYIRRVVVDEI